MDYCIKRLIPRKSQSFQLLDLFCPYQRRSASITGYRQFYLLVFSFSIFFFLPFCAHDVFLPNEILYIIITYQIQKKGALISLHVCQCSQFLILSPEQTCKFLSLELILESKTHSWRCDLSMGQVSLGFWKRLACSIGPCTR